MYIWNNQYDRNFKAHGKEYCLQHLKPITFDVGIQFIGTVRVKVLFSVHVFTKEYDQYEHDLSLRIQFMQKNRNPDVRGFDLSRYIWSMKLLNIFRNMDADTKIRKSERGFYIAISHPIKYQIYFNLSYNDAHKQIDLYVKSAYCKNNAERKYQTSTMSDCIRSVYK